MSLIHKVFSYSVVNVISAAVPFLLLPILTASLSPADFGELSLVMFLQAFLVPLILVNFNGLVTIEYSRLDSVQFSKLVGTLLWLPLLGGLFVTSALYVFRETIAHWLHIPSYWVVASAVVVLLQALPIFVSSLFQARQDVKSFGLFKISMTALNISLSIALVIGFGMGWEGRVWGIAITFALYSAIALYILHRAVLLHMRFEKIYFRDAISFGVPLIPHALSGTLLAMSDRVFQANMLSSAEVGIYSVAFQVATGVTIIMSSVNQAWAPHLFQQLNCDNSAENKRRVIVQTYKIAGLMAFFTLVFIVLSPIIFKLFIASSYHGGVAICQWISVAMMFQGFYFLVTNYVFYVKKTYLLSIITVIAAITIMLLNYWLIPYWGIIGSALAMCISWCLFFLMTWCFAQYCYPMPWLLRVKGSE